MNHNVKLALWWSLWENLSASVRSGDALSALLFLLTQSNVTVGVVQGINGVLQMLAALPAGYIADQHRRDALLRAGAAVGAVAGAVLAYALASRPTVWILGAAMALLGCYRGMYSAALEAIFADSIQEGRSGLYTHKYAITVLASSFGPWLSLALFHHLGNRWEVDACRLVLLSGVLLMVAPLLLMCMFDDDKALLPHTRGQCQQQPQQQQEQGSHACEPLLPTTAVGSVSQSSSSAANGTSPAGPALMLLTAAPQQQSGQPDDSVFAVHAETAASDRYGQQQAVAAASRDPITSLSDPDLAESEVEAEKLSCCSALPAGLVVTLLISVSDFIGAFASGMTIKFFGMYFFQAVSMSPAMVSLLGALSPLGVCAASLACQPLSKVVGRVQISLFTRCLDIVLMVTMAYLPTNTASARNLLMAVHLLRAAVANATRPLMRSVLMDFVPRRHRGKVNAVDSVRSFSWSGSAALGGFLIEIIGFRRTFLVTAGIKTVAFVPLFFLLAYVPDGICVPAGKRLARLQQQQQWQRQRWREVDGGGECKDDLRQPLLP